MNRANTGTALILLLLAAACVTSLVMGWTAGQIVASALAVLGVAVLWDVAVMRR